MTISDSRVHVGLEVAEQPQPVELVDESFRILILGAFSGRAGSSSPPLANRVVRIDRDGIDAAMAVIAPEVRLAIDPSADPDVIAFVSLDDLHPDRLLQSVALLKHLRSLRAEFLRPGAAPKTRGLERETTSAAAPRAGESLLDMILDDAQPRPTPAPTGDDDGLSELIRRAVRPHLAPEVSQDQAAMLAQIDDAIVAALRVVLHRPEFQALESGWRGADFFLRRLNAGAESQVAIADLSAIDLRAALADSSSDALRDLLRSDDGSPRWSLVLCTHAFESGDVALLGRIAEIGAASHTPWLVSATPGFVGATSFAEGADADDWDPAPPAGWDALRRGADARYVGVALPRFLLRSPYGAETDSIDTMPFEEFVDHPVPHESYLWGSAVFVCGLIATEEVERGASRKSHGTIGGLPFHVDTQDGIPVAKPSAEALISQRTVMHLLDRGVTPLVSQRDGDVVRVPRLQSIATPPAPLAIRQSGAAE